MGSNPVSQSSSASVLDELLVRLLTRSKGVSLNSFAIHLTPSVVPPPVPDSIFGVPLVTGMNPPVIPTSIFCTSQTPSTIPPSAPAFEYGITWAGV